MVLTTAAIEALWDQPLVVTMTVIVVMLAWPLVVTMTVTSVLRGGPVAVVDDTKSPTVSMSGVAVGIRTERPPAPADRRRLTRRTRERTSQPRLGLVTVVTESGTS